MITKRQFACGVFAALAGCGYAEVRAAEGPRRWSETLSASFAGIEQESGGRLGVAVLDTQDGNQAGHRADERFPMCSTFKLLVAGAALARVDAGKDRLDRRIRFEAADLVAYSPISKDRAGGEGMSIAELCEAAMIVSDNTAANLLLATLGGPAGLTAFARSLGDAVTRLDRIEPDLNEAVPGDPRDTTSPAAMLSNLRALTLGSVLAPDSRDRLTGWLIGNKTGDKRLRAGLPGGWRVGDKTGSGERGTANDIAIIWPRGRAPVLAAFYLTGASSDAAQRDAMAAAVGRAIAASLG
jgi:beta-lactamase class A